MSFNEWLAARQVTDTPRGDLIGDIRREGLVAYVRNALLDLGWLDDERTDWLAERIADGGGGRAQRRAMVDALYDRCDPDADDAALDRQSGR